MNSISDLLGCRYPIIQGAMSHISNPEMVAAVSEAGGYGILAAGFITDPDILRQQIKDTRKLTGRPFGANLVGQNPRSMLLAEVITEMSIRAVTTSAGFSKELVNYLKGRGIKVLHVVPNVAKALKAEAVGVDAVIAEGTESGGAQGPQGVSTMVLVPMVADAIKIPVVAAGGIGDARGFRAALALGAQGVQLGTRFFASHECISHLNCKEAICRAKETDTFLITLDEGFFARVLRKSDAKEQPGKSDEPPGSFFSSRPKEVLLKGNLEDGWVTSGQIAGMIKEIKSVKEIIEEIVS